MGRDWDAVAAAIQARLAELDMTQAELAAKAGVAPETVRELRTNATPRRRSPRTLSAISEALGWAAEYLATVLSGAAVAPETAEDAGELAVIRQELTSIAGQLTDIASRLGRLERP